MTNTKVMRWSQDHRDHYVFDHDNDCWQKVVCRLGANWDRCTAPSTLPRGTKFDYNSKLSDVVIA